MPDRVRQRRNRGTFRKRQNMWIPFYVEELTLSASGSVSSGDMLARYNSEVGREVPIGSTIGPIIGNVTVLGDAVNFNWDIFAGIQLIDEGQNAGTVTLELEPGDFIWYGTLMGNNIVNETAAGTFTPQSQTFPILTRAMRKTKTIGEELVITFDEVSADVGVSLRVALHTFLKLP